MSDSTTIIVTGPAPEIWTCRHAYRWARLAHTTTEADVLQVAWQSNTGEIEWRRVETVIVTEEDYRK